MGMLLGWGEVGVSGGCGRAQAPRKREELVGLDVQSYAWASKENSWWVMIFRVTHGHAVGVGWGWGKRGGAGGAQPRPPKKRVGWT